MYNLMFKLYDLFVFLCDLTVWVEITNYPAWKRGYSLLKEDKFSPNSTSAQVVGKPSRAASIASTTVAKSAKKRC